MSWIYIAIPGAAFVCYGVLMILMTFSRRDEIKWAFMSYLLAMMVWSFASMMMRTGVQPSVLFWNRILVVGVIFMPVTFYYFMQKIMRINRGFLVVIGLAGCVILMVLNFNGQFVTEAYIENGQFIYELGYAAIPAYIWGFLYLFLAIFILFRRISQNKMDFRSVKYVFIGTILIIPGTILNLLPAIGKYPIDIAVHTINAILIAYSIFRYRFMEVRFIIKKGLTYSAFTLVLTTVFILIIYSLEITIRSFLGYPTIIIAVIMALILASVLQPVKVWMQKLIDKIYYKDQYNQRLALINFNDNLADMLDLNQLSDSLLNAIKNGINCEKVMLALADDNDDFYIFASSDNNESIDIKFKKNHPMIRWFYMDKKYLTINQMAKEPYFRSLWAIEKQELSELGLDLAIPIRGRGKVSGIIMLTQKENRGNYSDEDIDMLLNLVSSSGVVIDNARLYQQARKEADTDNLTQLYNHRYFHNQLQETILEQPKTTTSMLLISMDLFKLYNDLYGHYEGDKALTRMGKLLTEHIGDKGIAARYAGDEFAILLPGISGDAAMQIAEIIRRDVENGKLVEEDNIQKFLTLSIGVATYPQNAANPDELIKCTDLALYSARRAGKNKCILYMSRDVDANTPNSIREIDLEQDFDFVYSSPVYALAAAIDAKDHYTFGHSENVSRYGTAIASAMGLDNTHVELVRHAGLLHDIGKIGVAERILTKPGSLTKEEFSIMQKHVTMSIDILKHIPNLNRMIPAVLGHHERWDGNGYPRGIKGNNIPIEARCLNIADAFDAMTTDRPYQKAVKKDEALIEIENLAGRQFDPDIVKIFIELVKNGTVDL